MALRFVPYLGLYLFGVPLGVLIAVTNNLGTDAFSAGILAVMLTVVFGVSIWILAESFWGGL